MPWQFKNLKQFQNRGSEVNDLSKSEQNLTFKTDKIQELKKTHLIKAEVDDDGDDDDDDDNDDRPNFKIGVQTSVVSQKLNRTRRKKTEKTQKLKSHKHLIKAEVDDDEDDEDEDDGHDDDDDDDGRPNFKIEVQKSVVSQKLKRT